MIRNELFAFDDTCMLLPLNNMCFYSFTTWVEGVGMHR